MIVDSKQITTGTTLHCDICIIGSGAAGVTLAHELRQSGLEVILLEAGGEKLREETQDPFKGEVTDTARHGALHEYRHCRLGGTTAVWGGRCAPFTESDFERREHVPHSGWPLAETELEPFYARANVYCHAGEYEYDAGRALPGSAGFIPGFESADVDTEGIWRFSPPTHFGLAYRQDLASATKVKVILNANCLRLACSPDGQRIQSVEAASTPSQTFYVEAANFALACGGLEVARLLLASNQTLPNGIGNDYGLVGRFYVSHLTGDAGEVQIPGGGAALWNYLLTREGVYCRRTLTKIPSVGMSRCGVMPSWLPSRAECRYCGRGRVRGSSCRSTVDSSPRAICSRALGACLGSTIVP